MKLSILFVAVLTTITPDLGEGKTLTSVCISPEKFGQQATIACYGYVTGGLYWVKPRGQIVRRCKPQKKETCLIHAQGYSSPTDNDLTKDILVIKSMREDHVGVWACRDDFYQSAATCSIGPSGNKPCVPGLWDHSCSQVCGRCEGSTCDKATGSCLCKTGWAPPKCTACVAGFWGQSCSKRCGNCTESKCDRRTGSCTCKSGWAPPKCTVRLCPAGFWGQSCSKRCVNCKGSKCDRGTGRCTCKSGWAPPTCTICAYGYWEEQQKVCILFIAEL
ncbi:scavenger receptor class F member 1-like [Gigantopelta aegis]|uniref:scavenger receptor class F member 1-like n=1 Tax=Gigantopelta aegis TaxID=1735272 RepID=UPI001B888C80|nr:scavenger receptor class F member 1-like [Gigantopelta aegis]